MADQEQEILVNIKLKTFGGPKAVISAVAGLAKILKRVYHGRVEIRYTTDMGYESFPVVFDETIKENKLRFQDGRTVLAVGE